jgi:RHS repeat-associated protein
LIVVIRLSSLGVSPYSYNSSNQLSSTPQATFTYDQNGNTLTKADSGGTTTYGWDYENRLTSATLPSGAGVVTFKYDPLGRRIQKSGPAGVTNYLYDEANAVAEYDSAGNLVTRYRQGLGIDQPLAMSRAGATSYYHADGLGSITSLTDGSGSAVAAYTTDAFGKSLAAAGSVVNPFRYTGREWDQEAGLYYYRARYYDSQTGRFLSEDPIRFDGGINFYAYVSNNPLNRVDPTGQQTGFEEYQPSGFLGIDKACAERTLAQVSARFRPSDNDKYKHCVVSCHINVSCNGPTAVAAGIYKEVKDIFGPGNAEWADLEADWEGIKCEKKFTCEKHCRQKYP